MSTLSILHGSPRMAGELSDETRDGTTTTEPIKLKFFTDNPRHISLIFANFQFDPIEYTEVMNFFLTGDPKKALQVGGATVIHFGEKRTAS